MIFDGILFLLICISFYRGWKKGILWAVFSFVAAIVAILLSLKLSHTLANYLFENHLLNSQYTLLISFIVIFISIIVAFRMSITLVEKLLDKMLLGWANKLFGGLLYSFIVVFSISTILWLGNKVNVFGEALKKESKTYYYVEKIAPYTFEKSSEYIPMMKNLIQQIEPLIEKVAK